MANLDPWTLWIPDYHRMRFDYALHEGPTPIENGPIKNGPIKNGVVWLKVSEGVVVDARWTGTAHPDDMAWVTQLPGQAVSHTETGMALMGCPLIPHHQALPGCPIPTHATDPSVTTPAPSPAQMPMAPLPQSRRRGHQDHESPP